MIVGYSVTFAGVGPVGALDTDLVVGGAPPEMAGSAAAVSETTGGLGVALWAVSAARCNGSWIDLDGAAADSPTG